jgi:hypothetical protein
LQTTFAHGGKSDLDSDFKFETEYLLNCPIPNKQAWEAIWLQDCLADYFTNIVQVRRQFGTSGDQSPMVNYGTKPRVNPSWGNNGQEASSSSELPPYAGNGNSFYGVDEKTALKNAQADEGNVSAWQVPLHQPITYKFFKLLPYYAPTSIPTEMSALLANEKPMLGICLKRYGYDTRRQEPYRDGRRSPLELLLMAG